jgi:CRP-like cAMP-binding protein
MGNISMIETLMELPLFRGVTRERMSEIVGLAKFHFLKYLPNNEFITPGEQCTHLKFMLTGAARITISDPDGRFKVSQTLRAPEVILPDFLFGRNIHYPCSATAIEDTNIMQVSKSDYLRILNKDEVFMFNYLNYLSTNAQKAVGGVLAVTNGNIAERIALWIICLTQPSATDIVLSCKQRDLYTVFGVQRSSLISSLEGMRNAGLIDFTPTEIYVNSRKDMLDLISPATTYED